MNHIPFVLPPCSACAICESNFETLETLSTHILEKHSDEFLECPDCAQIFDVSSTFATHFIEHERYRLENKHEDSISVVENHSNFSDDDYENDENFGELVIESHNTVVETKDISKPVIPKKPTAYLKTNKPKPRKPASVEWQKHDNKERPFKCDICGRAFTLASSLKLHNRRHLDIKPHECIVCKLRFVQSSDLNKHLRKHTGERPYICNYCGIGFSQLRNLKNHMKIHTETPTKCKYCDKTFAINTSLTQHLKKHEGSNIVRCSTDNCSIPFTSSKDLQAHIRRKHSNGRPHNCTFCSKTFSRSCDLLKHRRIHLGEKLYSCTTCGKSFTHPTSLRNHQAVHTGLKPFQCSICGQSFSFAGNLKSHTRTHTGEKPHKCNVCGKTFGRTANLNEHVKIHTGEKMHKCEICGKAFTNSSTYSKHKKIHTGERPHKCNLCEREFIQLAHLKKHIRIHTGERPFACTYIGCNKLFRRSDTLASHIKIHDKQKKTEVTDSELLDIQATIAATIAELSAQPTELFQVQLQQTDATDHHVASNIPEINFHVPTGALNMNSQLVQQPSHGGSQFIQFSWT